VRWLGCGSIHAINRRLKWLFRVADLRDSRLEKAQSRCNLLRRRHGSDSGLLLPVKRSVIFLVILVLNSLVLNMPAASARGQSPHSVVQADVPPNLFSLALDPRGDLMAATDGGHCVFVWSVPSGVLLQRIEGASSPIAFSPSGRLLAVRQSKAVALWDIDSEKIVATFQGTNEPSEIKFGEKSNTMAVSYLGNHIIVWDIFSGRKSKEIIGFSPIALSTSGDRLTAANRSGISDWDVRTGLESTKLQKPGCNGLSSDGRFAICGRGSLSAVYDLSAPNQQLSLQKTESKSQAQSKLSPDGKLILRPLENRIVFWDRKTGKLLRSSVAISGTAEMISMSADHRRLAFVSKSALEIWNVSGNKRIMSLAIASSSTTGVSFTSDGVLAHIDLTVGIAKWNLRSGARISTDPIINIPKRIFSASLSAQSAVVIGTGIYMWNANQSNAFHDLDVNDADMVKVRCVPNSSLVAFGNGERLVLVDAKTQKVIRIWSSEAAVIEGFAVDPQGKYLASAGYKDSSIKLWDINAGDEIVGVTNLLSDASVLAFSRTGATLASAFYNSSGGNEIIIWSVPEFDRLATISSGVASVEGIAFDEVSGKLAVLGNDGFLETFDVPSGRLTKRVLSGNCDTVAIDRDAHFLACGGRGQDFVRLWDFHDSEFIANLYPIGMNDWIIEGTGGFYDASDGALDRLHWAQGRRTVSTEKLRQKYRTPSLWTKLIDK